MILASVFQDLAFRCTKAEHAHCFGGRALRSAALDARLFKKSRGSESKLSFMAHVLMENRNGLVVDTRLTKSTGKAERESAWVMAWRWSREASGALRWAAIRTMKRNNWWLRYVGSA